MSSTEAYGPTSETLTFVDDEGDALTAGPDTQVSTYMVYLLFLLLYC